MDIRLFVATKAFIVYEGKVLIVRESSKYEDGTHEGKFDIVGGRVKPGQSWKESLVREIKEETGLSVNVGRPFYTGEWRPVVRGQQWQIIGTYFVCDAESDIVVLSEDHDAFEWIDPKEFTKYPLIDTVADAFESFNELKT